MKKVLSILLCAVMLAASVIAAVPGSAILSDYNPISSAPADLTGATGTADSYMGAVKITPDTAGTAVSFTVPGVKMGLPNMSELTEEQIKAALKIAVEKAALCTQYYGSKGWIKE